SAPWDEMAETIVKASANVSEVNRRYMTVISINVW
ncbi:MAG: hypothetical protein ACI9G1_005940, partial [Pirellulaceae bacterium]